MTAFLSYAHRDAEYAELFLEGLQGQLKHSDYVELDIWDDSKILLGSDWFEEINKQIEKSNLAILLLSSSFLSSEFIEKVEFLNFIRRKKADGFKFYPVLLSHFNISQWPELDKIQFFHPKGIDYERPRQKMVYYGDLVNYDRAGGILNNPQREKFHYEFARRLEKALIDDFTNRDLQPTHREIERSGIAPKASVKAIRKFHGKSSLEQYIFDFEEATGFEDYVDELQGSRYHPKEIIPDIRTNFDFLGHGASKWTTEVQLLDRAIERIKRNRGSSRFMTFDPRKAVGLEDHKHVSTFIDERIKILKSLVTLKRLEYKHNRNKKEIQIRIYEELPTFRLAFINRDIVLVGHYNGHTRNSNESPIIVFNSVKEWSFYSAFQALYEARWEIATSVEENVWEDLQKLGTDLGIDTKIS